MQSIVALSRQMCFHRHLVVSFGLFLLFCPGVANSADPGDIAKAISINASDFRYAKNNKGEAGIRATINGSLFGVSLRGIKFHVDLRLPNGTPVQASMHAAKNMVGKGGRLISKASFDLKPGSRTFGFWAFFPRNAMVLPPKADRIVFRLSVYSGNIGSYYDADVKLTKDRPTLTRGIMLGKIECKIVTVNRVNTFGAAMAEPLAPDKHHSMVFAASNNALGCNQKTFYSGVMLKLPSGVSPQPSPTCPKGNVSRKGTVQVEAKEAVSGVNVRWMGKPLTFPLDWVSLGRPPARSVIASYYISCGGLWNVRECEVVAPTSPTEQEAGRRVVPAVTPPAPPRTGGNVTPVGNAAKAVQNGLPLIAKVSVAGRDLSSTRELNPHQWHYSEFSRHYAIHVNLQPGKELSGIRNHPVNRFRLRINDRHIFHMYCQEKDFFCSKIPLGMFLNQKIKLEVLSLDMPIAPYTWHGAVRLKPKDFATVVNQLKQKYRTLQREERSMRQRGTDSSLVYYSGTLSDVGGMHLALGRFVEAQKNFLAAIQYNRKVRKKTGWHLRRIIDAHASLGLAYAMSGQMQEFTQTNANHMRAIRDLMNLRSSSSLYSPVTAGRCAWELAETVLCFTGDENVALKYFWEGWGMMKPHLKKKGVSPNSSTMASNYPALTAVLTKNGIDYRQPDHRLRRLADIQEYRDFRGMDDRLVSTELWEKWLDAQCKQFVNAVESFPGVNNVVVVPGETQENVDEGLIAGYKKTPMGPLARLLAKDDLPPDCREKNVYANLTARTEAKLRAAILQAPADSLLPKDVITMSLKASKGSYPLAVMTAHAVLKTAAKLGRVKVGDMHRRATQKKWAMVDKLSSELRPYSQIAKRLRSLRPQGDRSGDKLGPWYHVFGILSAGAMVSPFEANVGATGEHFLKWIGSFGKAEGAYNKNKCTIDWKFSDDVAAKLHKYGRNQ